MRTPKWAKRQEQERAPLKAAGLAALLLLKQQGRLPDLPKTEIADALGISRWTLDRDLAAVEHAAAADFERFRIALAKLPQQETTQ